MNEFIFKCPAAIRFGVGLSEQMGSVLKNEYGYKKAFIGTDKGIVATGLIAKIEASFKEAGMDYFIYDELIPEPDVQTINKAGEVYKQAEADVILAVGGGSVIDTCKTIGLLATNEGTIRDYLLGGSRKVEHDLPPLFVIPTTAGTGAEMSGIAMVSVTEEKAKLSASDFRLVPRMAIIDPMTHVGMPPFVTATTGMDALTHAIECYISQKAEPITDGMCIQAIKMISQNLTKATANGKDMEARTNMAIAATVAGIALANSTVGPVHGISQACGAIAHVAHGPGNMVLLPYCMERTVSANPEKFREIAIAMGEKVEGLSLRDAAQKAVDAVFRLIDDLHMPKRLRDYGVTEEMFDEIVEQSINHRPFPTYPCKLSRADILEIVKKAY